MAKDMHRGSFEGHTINKLTLYSRYLDDALPVFLCVPNIKRVNIFDFFCGPGMDQDGNPGSPILAMESVRKLMTSPSVPKDKKIHLFFNDADRRKTETLYAKLQGMEKPGNVIGKLTTKPFAESFAAQYGQMSASGSANIVFMDQYGISEITREIFGKLSILPYTDFMFFIASMTGYRFQQLESVTGKLPQLTDDERSALTAHNIHRTLAMAYKRWIPSGCTRYISNFSLKHDGNVYGLVFSSGHYTGINRFLTIAWDMKPEYAGQADFDIDDDRIDPKQPKLFEDYNMPSKLKLFSRDLKQMVTNRKLIDNKSIFLYAMEYGVLAKHARDVIAEMVKEKSIPRQRLPISEDAMKKEAVMINYGGQ